MQQKGTIKKIWSIKNNGWFSGKFITPENEEYSISGMMHINPTENVEYIFEGDFVDTKDYGRQFKVKSGRINNENSLNKARQFLNSGFIKGIGEKTTEKIIRKFKNKTLEILENDPDKLLTINGISKKKLNLIIESYQMNKGFLEFYEVTDGQITANMARKILVSYNNNSQKAIKALYENPYEFIEKIDGVGFLKADKIAENIHIDKKSLFRAEAALSYVLLKSSNDEGHMYLSFEDLQTRVLTLLNPFVIDLNNDKLKNDIVSFAMDNLDNIVDFKQFNLPLETEEKVLDWFYDFDDYLNNIAIALNNNVNKGINIIEDDRVYYKSLYTAETESAKLICEILNKKPLSQFSDEEIDKKISEIEKSENEKLKKEGKVPNFKLNKEQIEAIHNSLNNNLSIITGGPGRGKTEVLNIICSFFQKDNIILCAPTGKASQKMREATHNNSAKTIHRLIYTYEEGKRQLDKSVKNKLVIIDESSMIDMKLAYDLLRYARNCQVIFVGDKDQLQSVGTGTFFSDLLLSSHIKKTVLKQCFRNTGSIVYNCIKVNDGEYFKSFVIDDLFKFRHVESNSIVKETVATYMNFINKGARLQDVCILCPMNKGSYGSFEINKQIRDILIPKNANSLFNYYKNDRVMVIKNTYSIETIKDNEKSLGLFNGDVGIISNFLEEDDEKYLELTLDDGRVAKIGKGDTDILQLAYCMTIHKSQGSEYKHIIIPFVTSYYVMLARNLLYTGISRAKQTVEILGQEKAINIATQNLIEVKRNSMFLEKINQILI